MSVSLHVYVSMALRVYAYPCISLYVYVYVSLCLYLSMSVSLHVYFISMFQSKPWVLYCMRVRALYMLTSAGVRCLLQVSLQHRSLLASITSAPSIWRTGGGDSHPLVGKSDDFRFQFKFTILCKMENSPIHMFRQ